MNNILAYLQTEREVDFTGYRPSMLRRRIGQRVSAAGCRDLASYLDYLCGNSDEVDKLVNALTIHVSRFFRNPLTFEYVARKVLPQMLHEKRQREENSVRIWSAGCAFGEEAYSVAILMKEVLAREDAPFSVTIFATDINEGALKKAKAGRYSFQSVEDVKYGLLKKYFVPVKTQDSEWGDIEQESFRLVEEIRDAVGFSVYDILHPNTFAPPESIFGGFDMVFCRNLLIYFNSEYQNRITEKLYKALGPHGYLVLGESEIPTSEYQGCFKSVNSCCHVYQKT